MISASIIDQGTIDTTLPATSDPSYQSAALCLTIRQQLAALRTAGFEFQKAQIADVTTYRTSLNDWLEDAQQREDEIIQNGVTEVVANLPDVLAIGSALLSGGADAVVGVVLNMVLERLFGGAQAALGSHGEADISMTEVVDKLEEIREQMEAILTEFNINLYNDPEGQSWHVGPIS